MSDKPKRAHRCPERCHKCPDMGGEIMPGCMGGAVYGDLGHCTCVAERRERDTVKNLTARLYRLEREFEQLRADLGMGRVLEMKAGKA